MNLFQEYTLVLFIVVNTLVLLKALFETLLKKNAFGLTRPLLLLGAFVWADALLLSPFWIITAFIGLYNQNMTLFWLFMSLFWVVRSLGEVIYWINQQFSSLQRNPPKTLVFHWLFHDDSIWFAHQLFWQCILIFSIVASLYLGHRWLS